jgi:hypothetical protein
MGHVFISYSRKDAFYAVKLVNALKLEGFNPWWDVDELNAGTHWQNRLHKQILTCDAYILIMSRGAKASNWVQDELIAAKKKGKPIFPLLLDDTELFLAIEAIQCEDLRGGKLPSEKFYERLARVTPRQKKAGQKVDSVHRVDFARKKKVDSSAEKITNLITKAGSDISDSFKVVSKVTGNLANATAKSKLVKKIRSGLKKRVKRTSKLFK